VNHHAGVPERIRSGQRLFQSYTEALRAGRNKEVGRQMVELFR